MIKGLASESCVIVGRCADYVLKDFPNVLSVFIHE
ncbi:MAG: cytidylate kinase family protein [Blautia hydrogenotrophica]